MITTVKTSSVVQGLPKYRSMLAGNPAYMPPSFESIATATGTGSSGTITFSSIPSGYTHLQIRAYCKASGTAGSDIRLRFNSDSGANYTKHYIFGDSANVSVYGVASQNQIQGGCNYWGLDLTYPTAVILDIFDAFSTTKYKTVKSLSGIARASNGEVDITSGLWLNTNAITSITYEINGAGNFSTDSRVSLYGIKAA